MSDSAWHDMDGWWWYAFPFVVHRSFCAPSTKHTRTLGRLDMMIRREMKTTHSQSGTWRIHFCAYGPRERNMCGTCRNVYGNWGKVFVHIRRFWKMKILMKCERVCVSELDNGRCFDFLLLGCLSSFSFDDAWARCAFKLSWRSFWLNS
jgi:hypothetical protein